RLSGWHARPEEGGRHSPGPGDEKRLWGRERYPNRRTTWPRVPGASPRAFTVAAVRPRKVLFTFVASDGGKEVRPGQGPSARRGTPGPLGTEVLPRKVSKSKIKLRSIGCGIGDLGMLKVRFDMFRQFPQVLHEAPPLTLQLRAPGRRPVRVQVPPSRRCSGT